MASRGAKKRRRREAEEAAAAAELAAAGAFERHIEPGAVDLAEAASAELHRQKGGGNPYFVADVPAPGGQQKAVLMVRTLLGPIQLYDYDAIPTKGAEHG